MASSPDKVDTLTSLKWEKCSSLPEEMRHAQAVWLGDKLYVGGGETSGRQRDNASLYMYAPTTDTWSRINTPVYFYALTTYRSQLVLVGGKEYAGEGINGPITNKLWTLTEHGQWSSESLPPMTRKCYHASAVEFADNILVAGGKGDKQNDTEMVELYDGHQWAKVECLPKACYQMKSTVLNGHWYLMGGWRQGKEVYYSSLDSLVASCQPSEIPLPSVWKRLPDVPHKYCSAAVFGNRLIAVGGEYSSSIHAYSPHTQSWVHVWDMPVGLQSTCTAVLPQTGELMVIGGNSGRHGLPWDSCVYKASLNDNITRNSGVDEEDAVVSDQQSNDGVWQLPGVEEYSDTTVSVSSSQGQVVEWSGLKLDIHEGSLPEGCKVHIKSSLAGKYEIPEGSGLVSAVYWVRYEPQCTIAKPITIEIPHCSATEDVSKLKIVRAVCSRKHGSYKFKPVGGRFDTHTSYGVIEVNHFSGYGVVEEESPDPKRKYYCQPFYRPLSRQRGHEIRACIVFVWNTEAHINHVGQKYSEGGFVAGYHKVIEVAGDVIEVAALEVAKWTEVMKGEWEIQPAQPMVSKVELDDFKTGRGIPACVVEARSSHKTFPELLHEITLKGIKPPQDKLILCYRPSESDIQAITGTAQRGQIGRAPRRSWWGRLCSCCSSSESHPPTDVNDQLSNPQSPFINRGAPAGYTTQQGYPLVPVSPQHGITGQPYITSTGGMTAVSPVQGSGIGAGAMSGSPGYSDSFRQSYASQHESTRLHDHHLSSLLQHLSGHAARWRGIGIHLGFGANELEAIQCKPALYTEAPASWLQEMLSQWLQWAPGDSRGSNNFATLEGLKTALFQAGLGATAHDLRV